MAQGQSSYETFADLLQQEGQGPSPTRTQHNETPSRRERYGRASRASRTQKSSTESDQATPQPGRSHEPDYSAFVHTDLDQALQHSTSITSQTGKQNKSSDVPSSEHGPAKKVKTVKLLVTILSLLAAQLLWSLEFAYGNPYLLSLDLSRSSASLIWLAGPAAGLFCQPIVGSLSDADTSSWRRRKYILASFLLTAFFALLVAYASPIARALLRVFSSTQEWDPHFPDVALRTAVWIAVPAFWGLDFALNALQAASRALLLDTVPGHQQPSANAWQGKVTQLGNVVGYGLGFTDLGNDRLLRHLPGGQFGRLIVLGLLVSGACIALTCANVREQPQGSAPGGAGDHSDEQLDALESEEAAALRLLKNIRTEILQLPKPVSSVCFAQFFSWIGWFPFLFFASTFISERFAAEHDYPPTSDIAVRSGSLALLYHAIVGLSASVLLPLLYWLGRHPASLPAFAHPFFSRLTLRNIWFASQLLFGSLAACMFFSRSVRSGVLEVAALGVCWAVTAWIPFAMVMEMIHELKDQHLIQPDATIPRVASAESTLIHVTEHDRLIKGQVKPVSGGTILGIHNLAIVVPQFLTSILASIIFKIASAASSGDGPATHQQPQRDGIAYVFLLGSVSAFVAAILTRKIPPTQTEIRYKDAYKA